MMVVLDTTIVNVALPSIQRGFHFSATDLEWVVNAYTLTFGGLLLLGGRAGDLFGRRRMFIAGLILFSLGSLAGGLATGSIALILARTVQGIGAAVTSPATLALIADTFPEGAQRHRAIGVFTGVSVAGGAIGLLLGGIITTYVSWRWIFYVNVPVGLLVALAAPRYLAAARAQSARLDLPGALAVTGGATLLVYGLSRVATYSWSDGVTLRTLAISAILLLGFVGIEALTRQPLMPLDIFANRNRSTSYLLSLGNGATLSGMLFLLTLFLQNIRGFTPLQAGLAFPPTTVGVVVGAGLTSRLIGRVGPRIPMTLGSLLSAGGLFWLSRLNEGSDYASAILGPLLVLSAGLGQIFVSTGVVALSGITADRSGLSSALLNVGRQLGGSLGIAIMGSVAANGVKNQLANGPLTRAALNHATASGFASALQLASLIAAFGCLIAFAVVRHAGRPVTVEQISDQAPAA
jgi:EmrB/QacA subfamily drug resistance transporter